MADAEKTPALKTKIEEQRAFYSNLLFERAQIFTREATEVDLLLTPYQSGFFITVPTANARAVAERLMQERIFVVPLKKGVRVAICGIPTYKVTGVAEKIKKAL